MASPTFKGALKDGFGEADVAPEQLNFRLLIVAIRCSCGPTWKLNFAPHPVVGLVLQAGDAEKFP